MRGEKTETLAKNQLAGWDNRKIIQNPTVQHFKLTELIEKENEYMACSPHHGTYKILAIKTISSPVKYSQTIYLANMIIFALVRKFTS